MSGDAGGWQGDGKQARCRVCHRFAFEHRETPCKAVLVGWKDDDVNAESVARWPSICRPIIRTTFMYQTDQPNSRERRYFFTGDWTSQTWVDDAWAEEWLRDAIRPVSLEQAVP